MITVKVESAPCYAKGHELVDYVAFIVYIETRPYFCLITSNNTIIHIENDSVQEFSHFDSIEEFIDYYFETATSFIPFASFEDFNITVTKTDKCKAPQIGVIK